MPMAYKIPKKIAIVLDGNRRFARKLGLKPWLGHEHGIKKLEELHDLFACRLHIKITVF